MGGGGGRSEGVGDGEEVGLMEGVEDLASARDRKGRREVLEEYLEGPKVEI